MSAPVLEDVVPDMPLEQVPPVNRTVPPLRRRARRGGGVAASLALVGALLSGIVAATSPAPPLSWMLASGSLDADGTAIAVDATAPLDTPLTAGDDGAVLTARGARLELAPGTEFAFGGAGVGPVAQTVQLRAGSLVADVEVTLSVDATVATASGFGGAFRVERDETPRVATYSAAVGIAGDTAVSMTRLSQVPLGRAQDAVGPIILDPDDPWDARYAETALEADAQLANLATGLRSSYGEGAQRPAFYRDFVGVTEGLVEALPQFAPSDRGDRFGPPAETLIAATALRALVEGTGQPLGQLLPEVLAARAAGGTWGVLLARNDLDAVFVRGIADEALRRRAEQGDDAEPVLPPEPEPGTSDAPEPEPDSAPEPAPPPADADPDPEPDPDPAPEPDPEPEPDPDPEPGPIEDPVGTIEDLIGPDDGLLVPPDALVDGLGTSSFEVLGAPLLSRTRLVALPVGGVW